MVLQFWKLYIQQVSQPVWNRHNQISIAMASGSYARRSLCINSLADSTEEQNKLAGQSPIRRFNVGSNEAPTKASISLKVLTSPLILFFTKDLFTKFMKMFIKIIQAQTQALVEPQEQSFKARIPEIYWGKSHMECYQFYQKCEDHFETSGTIKMNYTSFATSFLCGFISIK